MEVDQIQCKFQRINDANGRVGLANKLGQNQRMEDRQYPDEEDEGERKTATANGGGRRGGVDLDVGGSIGRFYGWPSSRIVRVSRASGGKDRHSKVLTSKGLRDRRVRLSVNTAIQFYDLQDRLGYDQPSKAVEWLLKAAASAITELPPMNNLFPDTPRQASDEKRSSTGGSEQLCLESAEVEINDCGGNPSYFQQKQAMKSSACSSNSETSKNSDLSLSRSDIRIKARERAKGRVAEKEKEVESLNPISQTTSFTELLSGGLHNVNEIDNSPNSSVHQTPNRGGGNAIESNFFLKSPSTSMDYFTSTLLGPPSATVPAQMQFVNAFRPLFSVAGDHGSEIQSFAFAPEHFSVAGGGNNDGSDNHGGRGGYNLNFTISPSPGLSGFNRGTLQSNSLPPVQRFSPTGGSPPNYFIGGGGGEPVENHHQFHSGFDGRLQLHYGNDGRHSGGQKGKGKN